MIASFVAPVSRKGGTEDVRDFRIIPLLGYWKKLGQFLLLLLGNLLIPVRRLVIYKTTKCKIYC